MFTELFSPTQIADKIDELAEQIAKDYGSEPLVVVGVLTGGFITTADLVRALWNRGMNDITIDFVKVSSYVNSTESNRHPKIMLDLNTDITGKNVLIVEDIADTGHTLNLIQHYLKDTGPKTLKTLALLNKPSRREVEINLDYVGFEVEGWIEGYGLDAARACPSVLIKNSG